MKNYQRLLRCCTRIGIFAVLVFSFLAGVALLGFNPVRAQSIDTSWGDPVNLSHSGSVTNPNIIIDSDSKFHVMWEDAYGGIFNVSGDGKNWDSPTDVKFAFLPSRAHFFASNSGLIHAFWVNDKNELFYSNVTNRSFGDPSVWQRPVRLASSVIAFTAAIDLQDRLHIAFVDGLDMPAVKSGVYYQNSEKDGSNWSNPIPLIQSAYFNHLKQDQANISIAVSDHLGSTNVYVAWDDRPRKQVLFATSNDGGGTWKAASTIDGPSSNAVSSNPFGIRVGATDGQVLLTWQNGSQGISCSQYSQSSKDGGSSWSVRQTILDNISGCIQDNQLFTLNQSIILMTSRQSQVFLIAWDGSRWSEPQLQSSLSGFQDKDVFNQVSFGCRRPVINSNARMYVVGCDTGGGGDIWITSRDLGNTNDWFPNPSGWNDPAMIYSTKSNISSPVLVADPQNRIHGFWSQIDRADPSSEAIYYSRQNGASWTQPIPIVSSQSGKAEQPAVAVDHQGRLLLAWTGGKSGEIDFSWASSDNATNVSEWTKAQSVSADGTGALSPDIAVDKTGNIWIAYAIPLNEQRGIYLVRSEDAGITWSKPVEVFNGAKAGWDMVNQPHLCISEDGTLHLIWTRYTLPFEGNVLGLFSIHSGSGDSASPISSAADWSDPVAMVEGSVTWSKILTTDGQIIQVFWQEDKNGNQALSKKTSLDGGLTWNPQENIPDNGGEQQLMDAFVDRNGQMRTIQLGVTQSMRPILMERLWDGKQWKIQVQTNLLDQTLVSSSSLASVITNDGRLVVVFTAMPNQNPDPLTETLFFTSLTVDLESAFTAITPTPTNPQIKPTATSIATSMPTPSPEPTLVRSTLMATPTSQGNDNNWSGLILGGVLAVSLVIGVVIYRVRVMSTHG